MRTVGVVRMLVVAALSALPVQAMAVSFTIGTGDINDGAVTESKISAEAVTNDKIKTGTISKDKLNFTIDAPRFANIVTVAKSGGDFDSPIAAVNSITGASAAGPYLVKVMPGVYDLGNSSVQMKEYVYLEGSGEDNTIITSNTQNIDTETCEVGTINMANNSSIKNIKIVNTNQDNTDQYLSAAVVFNNVKAKAEGVKVLSGTVGFFIGKSVGICSYGASGHAILNNVYSEAHGSRNTSAVMTRKDGSLTIVNSRLLAGTTGGDADTYGINCTDSNVFTGKVTVSDTSIESTSTQGGVANGIETWACDASIYNSRIKATTTGINSLNLNVNIFNSQIYVDAAGTAISNAPGVGTLKIANSLLTNWTPDTSTTIKLRNNYDQDLSAIANQ